MVRLVFVKVMFIFGECFDLVEVVVIGFIDGVF